MAARLQLEGTFTALVTPFTADGSAVDFDALKALVDRQVEAGVNCVPVSRSSSSRVLAAAESCAHHPRGLCGVEEGRGGGGQRRASAL